MGPIIDASLPTHSVCPGTEGNSNMDVEQGKVIALS